MTNQFYDNLVKTAFSSNVLDKDIAHKILSDKHLELLPLLHAAYTVRKHYRGKEVTIHILNNAQNGFCPEDCSYCAQSKFSETPINEYPMKNEKTILDEAKKAYESGAFRYCIVTGGRGPSPKRVDQLANLIKKIKKHYPLEICLSAGLVDDNAAQKLKNAGLDRLNHNLNTSRSFYSKICSTHTYNDRLQTLQSAKKAQLDICSGVIVGMGESHDDLIDVALELRNLQAPSVPVNFLIPIDGTPLKDTPKLTPLFCLKVLCLFRFINPQAEIRVSAGREGHLRSMEVLSLYPSDSLFLEGYLNTKGTSSQKTLQMIQDAGFHIKSNFSVNELLQNNTNGDRFSIEGSSDIMKKHTPSMHNTKTN